MKKVILSLIAVFQLMVFLPVSAEESPVPVYMFTKEGCSACDVAHEYFENLKNEEGELFDLITIEVFNAEGEVTNQNAVTLLVEVYNEFEEDTSKISTPTIVIGDYHTLGFPQDESVIYDAILDVKENEDSVDTVKKLADDADINIDDLKEFEEDMPSVNEEENENGKYDAIIIVSIFVVLIGGCIGLIIIGRK